MAGVDLGGDGEVAGLGEAAAQILDVLVDAEDFFVDEDDGERPSAVRLGGVARHLAIGDRDLHFAAVDADRVGVDDLRLDGGDGEGEAADEARHEHAAAGRAGSA